jgi:hypothetical protein
MSDWPETLKVGPIGDWPGQLTRQRRASSFSARFSDTLTILRREIYNLVDTKKQQDSAEVLIAIPAGAFRLDGRPYANAKAEHPGVIFSIDSRHGHLSYPCDTFTTWQDNLRAIALALEALRKVDRYGVTSHGEQYRGFLAIEGATAMPAGFATASDAERWLRQIVDATSANSIAAVLRLAKRRTHPDLDGDAATFQRVTLAEAKLREEGVL